MIGQFLRSKFYKIIKRHNNRQTGRFIIFYRNGVEMVYFAERDLSNQKSRKIGPSVQQLYMDRRKHKTNSITSFVGGR